MSLINHPVKIKSTSELGTITAIAKDVYTVTVTLEDGSKREMALTGVELLGE